MRKVNFTSGVKPLVGDMNNLHNYTEEALFSLLQAVGGSEGKLLFNATAPTTSAVNGVVSLTIPGQFFAIDGAVCEVPETVWSRAASTDLVLGIYFVLRKAPISEERNFLSMTSDPIVVQQDLTTTVAFEDVGRAEVTVVTTITDPPEEPVLGPNDVGFVQLGFLTYNITTGVFTYTGNSAELFTLPAASAQAVPPHAASHLTSDRIPDALPNAGVEGGSTEGLLPKGGLTAILGSIQDIQPTDASSFVQITYEGSNTNSGNTIDPKTALLHIKTAPSLTAVSVDEEIALGVTFRPSGAVNGSSDIAARADHLHALTEFGLIIASQTIDNLAAFTSGVFSISALSEAGTVGKILSVTPYWVPPSASANFYGIPCGWMLVDNPGPQTLGCRATITGSNTFFVERGQAGAALVTPDLTNQMLQNNVLWENGQFATSGSIRLEILAVRAGTFIS